MSNEPCGVLLPHMNSSPFDNICANHFTLLAHHASMYWNLFQLNMSQSKILQHIGHICPIRLRHFIGWVANS